jgi:hypothetical protein
MKIKVVDFDIKFIDNYFFKKLTFHKIELFKMFSEKDLT